MSSASPGAAWQREDLVASYTERRRSIIPLLEVQEEVIRQLLERHGRPIARWLDLGCGDGAMTELVLAAADGTGPGTTAVLLDASQPMLERAGARMRAHGVRWQALEADLNDAAWPAALPDGRYDLVISGLAIHHLPAERKRALFAEVFELLEPGGMFLNMDCVLIDGPLQGLFDEQVRANAQRAGHEHGGASAGEDVDLDDADDDRPDSAHDQLRWLRDAGFAEVELHFKWAEAAVFGGVRPVASGAVGT
jgi:tRNA (cmo5U34)-methyltransferase